MNAKIAARPAFPTAPSETCIPDLDMDKALRQLYGPGHSTSPRHLIAEAPQDLPAPPIAPPRSHRLLPAFLRGVLADLGWWQNPAPQLPSTHLEQTLAVLQTYGWCQSVDVTVTGRLCMRGAQSLLQKTGHVTPEGRERAVHYMQQVLAECGVTMQFFAWNDLPGQEFSSVEVLLTRAASIARENGE
jgi:hypothetical protein